MSALRFQPKSKNRRHGSTLPHQGLISRLPGRKECVHTTVRNSHSAHTVLGLGLVFVEDLTPQVRLVWRQDDTFSVRSFHRLLAMPFLLGLSLRMLHRRRVCLFFCALIHALREYEPVCRRMTILRTSCLA